MLLSTVFKVVSRDLVRNVFFSSDTYDENWKITYRPGELAVGNYWSRLLAFETLEHALAYTGSISPIIWECQGEDPKRIPYLANYPENFERFWSIFNDGGINWSHAFALAPQGTVACLGIRLIRRVTFEEITRAVN